MNNSVDNVLFPEIDVDINHFDELYPSLNVGDHCKYYDDGKIRNLKTGEGIFSLFSFNCRSLLAHEDELSACLNNFDFEFDVISMTESWLQDSNKELANMNGYLSFHSLRTNRGGTGISVYVRDNYNARQINNTNISNDHIECLGLTLEKRDKVIQILTFYRPPKGNLDFFIGKFSELVLTVRASANVELFVCGDFNIDLLNLDNSIGAQHYITTCNSLSLLNMITKPTRITEDSATLLDHILVSDPNKITTGVIVNDISDHFPTFLISLDFFTNTRNDTSNVIKYRTVNDITLANMSEYLSAYDFNSIAENYNCDEALSRLLVIVREAYDKCCPIKHKTVSPKSRLKPWINDTILGNIKKRRAYYALLRQNKVPKYFYTQFRNTVTLQIRIAKREYFKQKFKEYKGNTKYTWNIINSILKPNRNKIRSSIKKLIVDDNVFESDDGICTSLNNFFC